jgi:hypothetical protein
MVGNSGAGIPKTENIHPTTVGTIESQSPKLEAAAAKIVRVRVRTSECSCQGGKRIGRRIKIATNKTPSIAIASPQLPITYPTTDPIKRSNRATMKASVREKGSDLCI